MKHLLSAGELDLAEALTILDTAETMRDTNKRSIRKLPALAGRTIAIMFFEDSTRTRLSFEAAAKRLSADVLNFSAKGSSLSKGESLKDTAQTLAAMGAEAFVMRHSASGAAHRLAHSGWIDAPVINGGDGTHQHPTQALLDAFTMRRHLVGADRLGQDLAGKKIVIVGDILHSRVARSNLDLLTTLGAEVTLVAPPTLLPVGIEGWNATIRYSLDEAIEDGPDGIMMLRVQHERMTGAGGGFFPSPEEYHRLYGLNMERMNRLPDHTILLHPGPMNRGLEISAEAADQDRSVVLEQVENGVYIRMAVLYLTLANEAAA
ncbi:aspartate carbamoyltransferase catalytic subunit [Flaviflexus salsibiostraticola]|uniref:Aspartate carbamoyltransferase n=1 Tax=Flaviflexus salsibiostraticola TaxID=1282737 RepID=A0A3S8Z7A1_9ACTO|nr:aspartate carbamoyltransferase catalytic subunit [Flaviflexus salsibiostraticola]AZN29265.1 aspartate carbamoyltransferase catalytic subunit [Flaviflexus salsibiostraticola]